MVSYASGSAGGIFGPRLFIGAMLGGIVGTVAQKVSPEHVVAPEAVLVDCRRWMSLHEISSVSTVIR